MTMIMVTVVVIVIVDGTQGIVLVVAPVMRIMMNGGGVGNDTG